MGLAESLPTGTDTGTGMPDEAAALGAFAFDRYGVYVVVMRVAGGRLADVVIFSYARYLFSKIVGRLSFGPFVAVGWAVTMRTVPPGDTVLCFVLLL